jgi:hypothetical protein
MAASAVLLFQERNPLEMTGLQDFLCPKVLKDA